MRTPRLCQRRAGVTALENHFTTRTRRPSKNIRGARGEKTAARVLQKISTVKRRRLPLPCPVRAAVPQTTHVANSLSLKFLVFFLRDLAALPPWWCPRAWSGNDPLT